MTSHRRKRSSIDDDEFEQLYQSICQSQTEDHIPTHLLTKQSSPLNAGKKQILEKGCPSGQSLKATRTLLCSDRSPVCLQRPQWQNGASLCSSNKEVEVPNFNETLANKRLTPRPPDCTTNADTLRLPDGLFRPKRDGEAAHSPSEADGEPSHDEVSILEDDDFGFRADVVRLPEAGGENEGHDDDDTAAAEDGLSWASGEEYDAARLCDTCVALFQKMLSAKKTKTKMKKKIDYNPLSLSCDQWILKKRRVCRTKRSSRGKLWIAIKNITMNAKNRACELRRTPSACSRPHVFLQRNLLKCKSKEAPVQNRHGKKRRAEDSTLKPQKKNGKMTKLGTGKKKMTKNEMDSVLEGSRVIYNNSVRKDRPFVLQKSNEDQDPNFDTLLEKTVSPGASVKTEHSWTKRQDCFSETLGNKSCKVSGNSSILDFPDPSRHFSWLQKGGFKSMLAKMENRQSTVVKESDSSASEGIF